MKMSNIAKKLVNKPFEGYLQVVKIANGKIKKLNNIKYENIDEIKNYRKEKDIYYTPNTSYNGKRGVENLKNLRELYLDFDLHKNLKKEDLKAEINFIIAEVWFKAYIGEIPRPSKAIISGRGVHVYWDLEPASYGALSTWQQLEDFLYSKLKYLGADRQATDAARILRLPTTVNSKNNEECYIYVCENNVYSMYELREKYLFWSERHKKNYVKKEKVNNKNNTINLFNSYTLHLCRAEDITKLVKLRKGNVTGYRNFIIHCYAYWKGIYTRDNEVLKDKVYKLNESFTEPLNNREIDKVLRCIPKAISKFLEYEQGLMNGQAKRVSKGMRERGGYWYKNTTLIEKLDITEEEQEKLKTIIGTIEKYKRNNKNRRDKRKNENGLTKREQQKQDLINSIKELKKIGYKQKDVSKKLNKGIATIKRYWNE